LFGSLPQSSDPVAVVKISSVPLNHSPAEEYANDGEPTDCMIGLWYASLEYCGWHKLVGLLSDGERRRADAFIFDRDARRFIVSHAVLRTLLGRATGVPAREVKFRAQPGVKPVLQAGPDRPIHFSLSRSEELVVIGFAPRPLGVDVERLGKTFDVGTLGKYVLSRCEQEGFRRLSSADRPEAFLRCWTQKEAYLKAIGTGLYIPPTGVEVGFVPGGSTGLKSIFGDARAAARWFVDVVTPRADYIAAVAIPGGQWRVRMTAFDTSSLLVSE
jgi:4'-phosphopantetheinyl transferase